MILVNKEGRMAFVNSQAGELLGKMSRVRHKADSNLNRNRTGRLPYDIRDNLIQFFSGC